ncbi:MAG: hypothetical protein H6Q35_735 [Proteobacteria bacterium]|nr:hypothetical protein [Pseudomonadota bacterium]
MKSFYGYCLIAVGFFFYSMALFLMGMHINFSFIGLWNVITNPALLVQIIIQSVSVFGLGIPFHLVGRRMVRQAQKRS